MKQDGFDEVSGDVVEAKARNDGSPQWQAEIIFTLGSSPNDFSGRARSMTIRGPYRTEKESVHDDVDKLLKASKDGGIRAVRNLAVGLKRSRIS